MEIRTGASSSVKMATKTRISEDEMFAAVQEVVNHQHFFDQHNVTLTALASVEASELTKNYVGRMDMSFATDGSK